MSLKEMYEKVSLIIPLEQRRFFNYYEDSVNELQSMYSGFVFPKDTDYQPPKALTDENVVLPLYHNAIIEKQKLFQNNKTGHVLSGSINRT